MEELSSFIFPFLEEPKLDLLKQNGIRTVMDFLIKNSAEIMSAGSLTQAEYSQARADALNFVTPKPVPASSLFHKLINSKQPFSTGIPKLDQMLGGGLACGELVEFYGKSNTGKTQMCLLIVSGLVSRVKRDTGFYLDLKHDFKAKRVFKMSKETDKEGLKNIYVVRESKIEKVLRVLDRLENQLNIGQSSFGENLRILALDALPFTLYPTMGPDNAGRGLQEILAQQLKRMATNYQLSVIMVNHAVSVYGAGDGSKVKSAMGMFWRSVPHIRILLARDSTDEPRLRATLEKSVRSETGHSFGFTITEEGIE